MSAPAPSGLTCDFNNFLYSAVTDDPDQTVSVLSALARHNVDPWDEAAQLAQMPKKIAIARLTSMISSANMDLTTQSRAELNATRLVELLPRPSVLGIPRDSGVPSSRPGSYPLIIACIVVALLFVAFVLFGN